MIAQFLSSALSLCLSTKILIIPFVSTKSLGKYCLKNYDVLHMDIGTADHCKVYYRKNDKYDKSMEYWKLYLIQLFLVIASYIMIYIGTYKYISIGVNKMFCMSKIRKGKSICLIFVIAVNIILFIIAIPFIVIAFPYFPIVVEATG